LALDQLAPMTIDRAVLWSGGSLLASALGFCGLCAYYPMDDVEVITEARSVFCLLCLVLLVAGLVSFLTSLDRLETVDVHAIKIVVFIALLGFFFAVGGFSAQPLNDTPGHFPDSVGAFTVWVRIVFFYVIGAILAVWGDKTTGMLAPISHRLLFVILGVGLMLIALFYPFAFWSVQSHQPSKPHAADSVTASQSCLSCTSTWSNPTLHTNRRPAWRLAIRRSGRAAVGERNR